MWVWGMHRIRSCALAQLTVLCLGGHGVAADKPTIRITNGEWVPYLGQTLPDYGLVSHIITESFAMSGISVEYGFFPWTRSLLMAQGGEWDATAVWFKTPEREEAFLFSDPVITSTYTFFHLKEFPFRWKTLEDLRGLKIGGTRNYAYGEAFLAAAQSRLISVDWAMSDETNFRKLLGKRIQVFPTDRIVGYEMISRTFPREVAEKFTDDPLPLKVDFLYLLFSKQVPKNKEMVVLFNQGLANLKRSGRYDQLIHQATLKR